MGGVTQLLCLHEIGNLAPSLLFRTWERILKYPPLQKTNNYLQLSFLFSFYKEKS